MIIPNGYDKNIFNPKCPSIHSFIQQALSIEITYLGNTLNLHMVYMFEKSL